MVLTFLRKDEDDGLSSVAQQITAMLATLFTRSTWP